MKKLDQLDLDILALLYRNAQLTNKEIAERVGVAASTCLERIRRLQADKVLKGIHAVVDFDALGGHIQAMVAIRLKQHSRKIIESFMSEVGQSPEVVGMYHLGGENDFQVHVTVKNTEHLRDFIYRAFTSRPEVVHIETALIYEYARGTAFPAFYDE